MSQRGSLVGHMHPPNIDLNATKQQSSPPNQHLQLHPSGLQPSSNPSYSPQPSPSFSSRHHTNNFNLQQLPFSSQPASSSIIDENQQFRSTFPSNQFTLESLSIQDLTSQLNKFQPSFLTRSTDPASEHFNPSTQPVPNDFNIPRSNPELQGRRLIQQFQRDHYQRENSASQSLNHALLQLVPHHHQVHTTPSGFLFQDPFNVPDSPDRRDTDNHNLNEQRRGSRPHFVPLDQTQNDSNLMIEDSSTGYGDDSSMSTTAANEKVGFDYCISTMILNATRFYTHLVHLIDDDSPYNYAIDRLYEAVIKQLYLQYDINFVEICQNRHDLVHLLREFVFTSLQEHTSLVNTSPKHPSSTTLQINTNTKPSRKESSVSSSSNSTPDPLSTPLCCGGGGDNTKKNLIKTKKNSKQQPKSKTKNKNKNKKNKNKTKDTNRENEDTVNSLDNSTTLELNRIDTNSTTKLTPNASNRFFSHVQTGDIKALETITDEIFFKMVYQVSERFATLHYLTNRSLYRVENRALNNDFKSHTHHGYSITHFNSRGEPVELIIKEHEYIYTEKDLYEEGVAFRITWAKQCAASVFKSMLTPQQLFRYRRDNKLENGNTNMFHFNGDRIRETGFFFNRVNFDIAEISGHRLGDDDLCSMIFAADWATGCYNAHSVGHAIRYEFGPYRDGDDDDTQNMVTDTINNNYDHLSHLSHQIEARRKKKNKGTGIEFYTTPIHHTIHGGDIYYTASKEEVHNNFLGGEEYCAHHSVSLRKRLYASLRHLPKKPKPETILVKDRKGRDRLQFPHGTIGRWASCGNHEMLSGGHAFKKCVLSSMGVFTVPTNIIPKFSQYTSFFTLENAYWRIVNLDTAYYSQAFGHPGLCMQHPDGNDCNCTMHKKHRFPPDLVHWLDNTVRLSDDNRGLIFVSHHMHTSAIEVSYRFVLKEVEQRIGTTTLTGQQRTIIWLAGDEHLTAIYHPFQADPATAEPHQDYSHNSFLFCLGATGMPARLFEDHIDNPTLGQRGLVLYDGRIAYTRIYRKGGTFNVGHPSFLRMDFNKNELTMRIRSLNSVPDTPQTAKRTNNSCHRFIVDDAYDIARYTFRINLETGVLSLATEPWHKEEPRLLAINPSPPRFFRTIEEFLPFYQKILIHCPKHPFRTKLPNSIDEIKFPLEVREEYWQLLQSLPEINFTSQNQNDQTTPLANSYQKFSPDGKHALTPHFLGADHFFEKPTINAVSSVHQLTTTNSSPPVVLSSSLTSRRRGSSKNVLNIAPLTKLPSSSQITLDTQQQPTQQQPTQQQSSTSMSTPNSSIPLPSLELSPFLNPLQPQLSLNIPEMTMDPTLLPSAQSIANSIRIGHSQQPSSMNTSDIIFGALAELPSPQIQPLKLTTTQSQQLQQPQLQPQQSQIEQPQFFLFKSHEEFLPYQERLEALFPLGGLRLYQLVDSFPLTISIELYQFLQSIPDFSTYLNPRRGSISLQSISSPGNNTSDSHRSSFLQQPSFFLHGSDGMLLDKTYSSTPGDKDFERLPAQSILDVQRFGSIPGAPPQLQQQSSQYQFVQQQTPTDSSIAFFTTPATYSSTKFQPNSSSICSSTGSILTSSQVQSIDDIQ